MNPDRRAFLASAAALAVPAAHAAGAEDKAKPRVQQYKIFVDQPITPPAPNS